MLGTLRNGLLALLTIGICGAAQDKSHWEGYNRPVRPQSALVDPQDRVLPHILAGGGWETVIPLLNMDLNPVDFNLDFYANDGTPLVLPFVLVDGSIGRFSSLKAHLPPLGNFTFTIPTVDRVTSPGWAILTYTGPAGHVAASAYLHQRANDGTLLFEATEPFANTQDFLFFFPFDNTNGMTTGLTIVNPAPNLAANVTIVFLDGNGNQMFTDNLIIQPRARVFRSLPDAYPALASTAGTLFVSGDTNRLSAAGIRIAPSGTVAVSQIFNWSGMFQ